MRPSFGCFVILRVLMNIKVIRNTKVVVNVVLDPSFESKKPVYRLQINTPDKRDSRNCIPVR